MTSQEDDATELQFPKGMETENIHLATADTELACSSCNSLLQYPYIQCFVCQSLGVNSVNICVSCFAKGKEFDFHKNDHDYIVKQNSPVFSLDWKAKEELELLQAIRDCGLGNWADVSKRFNNKSPEQCKEHYLNYFVNNPCTELNILNSNGKPPISEKGCYYSIIGTDDPPRPTPCSTMYREMAGYNAARSDFCVEYLNDAEKILQDVDINLFENEKELSIGQELQVALIDIYRRKLGEREIRKRIIREHGLINLGKASIIHNQYKSAIPKFADLIPAMHTILSHKELSYILHCLSYEEELKCHIRELKECRVNGLTKQAQVSIYDTMKKRREILKRRKHKLVLGAELTDINIKELIKSSTVGSKLPNSLRRTSIPLDITGETEYETLNSDEKEISSSLRIFPNKFNKIKFGMIEECRRLNGLQLRHARSQFKIDVNKIRRIYDYLLGEGLIYRPIPIK